MPPVCVTRIEALLSCWNGRNCQGTMLNAVLTRFRGLIGGFDLLLCIHHSRCARHYFCHFVHTIMRRSKLSAKCATGNEAFLLWHLIARFVWNVAGFESGVASHCFSISKAIWMNCERLWYVAMLLRCFFLCFGQLCFLTLPFLAKQCQTNVRQQLGSCRKLQNPHTFHP